MPYSKSLIVIVEDDSHVSRALRSHFEEAFPQVRIEIAGSPQRAATICEKYKPQLILWDGTPNERGTQQEYLDCIPTDQWPRVITISNDEGQQQTARLKGCTQLMAKPQQGLNHWAEQVVLSARKMLPTQKKGH